ncbi:MAG: response regulator [Alphaproteobacteria bacterium]
MQISDLKIVLVDDDLSVRKSVWFMLLAAGVSKENIRQAGNGEEALKLLEEQDAHLVWSDTQMPKMDGLQMTQAIHKKEEDSGGYTIVILTSGKDFNEAAMKAGAYNFFPKPVGLDLIKSTINTVLQCLPPTVSQPDTPEPHP